jgi:hypothetical protein
MRLIAVAFALALASASSVEAMPVAPLERSDGMVIPVRQGCGLGRQLVGGRCLRNSTVRKMGKCSRRNMRYVNGRCQKMAQPRPPAQPAPRPPAQPAPAPRG